MINHSKTEFYRVASEGSTVISTRISDIHLRSCFTPEAILIETRTIIASRLADMVMKKLAPAIDRALSELNLNESGT